ncbi:MAG: alpha/beta fold hydrolase [Actinomycetota bacterium]|nr:alpha/beta fold hydrolase [Actinomycetota bacterium]
MDRLGVTVLAAGAILAGGAVTVAGVRRRHPGHPQTTTPGATPAGATHPVPPEHPLEHRSVAAHIDATARTHPDRVALHTASGQVTYGELLAGARAMQGAAPAPTGRAQAALIPATLTPATVSTVLGLFAGPTTVVTIDPDLPANRIDTIADVLHEHDVRVVPVSIPAAIDDSGDRAGEPLGGTRGPHDVTSIQFTSGSTGVPKAVWHTNGLWLADAQLLTERFGLAHGRKVALCMPISFAGGLNVLLGSLMGGAEIIGVDPREYSAPEAFARLEASGAEAIACTPSFVDSLHRAAAGATLPRVQRLVSTGEPMQVRHVRLARELAPNAIITNWAGSTETLAIASFDIAPTAPLPRGVLPVGIPAPHKHADLGPDGTVSITSRYLGPGYLNGASLPPSFVDNGDGTTTYTGGDIGRWDPDGNLVLSGRADNTVKIRGYLVEPAEVEATLSAYDDVREVAVVAHLGSGASQAPALAAYVAPSTTERTPSVAELRTRLHRDLPPWMVPAHIEILTALPRGDRGKVDRSALPEPAGPDYEAPRGRYESAVAQLWAEVLRIERIGRSDSFYALGGDSLSVTQMLVALRDMHGIHLTPSDLACAPTVADFAQKLDPAPHTDSGHERLRPTTVALRPMSPETEQAPLFCFTGAGASALCFLPLAERVGPHTPVYAFEPSGLTPHTFPDWSIARAVARHLTDLRRIQPRGPYTLVGHSLGAHIALETARLLEADGEDVEMVVMLDPWLSPRVAHHARRDVPGATVTLQTDEANGLRTWWERQRTVPLAGLFLNDYARKTRAVEEVGMIAGYRHEPRPWGGRALLMLSHLNADDPRLWTRILTGELQTHTLDCDHHSVVRPPHIDTVVEAIAAARDELSSSAAMLACRR